jgi:high-affinity iron transporter
MDGPLGSVLAGMFGYQDAPTVSTLGAYLIYLAVALVMFFLPAPAPKTNTNTCGSEPARDGRQR